MEEASRGGERGEGDEVAYHSARRRQQDHADAELFQLSGGGVRMDAVPCHRSQV